jgi:zinc protease
MAALFAPHPYGNPIIGSDLDIMHIGDRDLRSHHEHYYHAANALLVIAGGNGIDRISDIVLTAFEALPAAQPGASCRSCELPAIEARRLIMKEPGPGSCFHAAYAACPGGHPDTFALILAAQILGGSQPWGTALSNRSSRLHHALVEGGLADAVRVGYHPAIECAAFQIAAIARRGRSVQALEDAVNRELEALISIGPSKAEVAAAQKRTRAELAYAMENLAGMAALIGKSELSFGNGDPSRIVEALSKVRPEDIQQVTATYLVPERSSVGWLLPDISELD